MRKLFLSALVPLSLLAACDTPGGLDFDFRATSPLQTPSPLPADSIANPSGGILYVTRSTTTPCFTDGLTARGSRDESRLTLRVQRIAASPCPDDRDRYFRYQAFFGNLRSGTYQVRVVEEISGAAQVVADTAITVR